MTERCLHLNGNPSSNFGTQSSSLNDVLARMQGDLITYETVGMDMTTVLRSVWFDGKRNTLVISDECPAKCAV